MCSELLSSFKELLAVQELLQIEELVTGGQEGKSLLLPQVRISLNQSGEHAFL